MPIELKMLGWSVVLGLAYVLVAAGFGTWQRGLKWNASNRDGEPKPLTGMAARAERANRNFLETFAFFAAATLAVVFAHKTGTQTAIGAQIYFWARVACHRHSLSAHADLDRLVLGHPATARGAALMPRAGNFAQGLCNSLSRALELTV